MDSRIIFLDTPTRKESARDAIAAAPADFECIVRKRRSKRNLDQNAASWAIYTEAAKEVGESPQGMHDIAIEAYGGSRKVTIGGVEFTVLNLHTSKFSVKEMSDYLDWLVVWATDNVKVNARAIRRNYRC